jgi:hypothetical protein
VGETKLSAKGFSSLFEVKGKARSLAAIILRNRSSCTRGARQDHAPSASLTVNILAWGSNPRPFNVTGTKGTRTKGRKGRFPSERYYIGSIPPPLNVPKSGSEGARSGQADRQAAPCRDPHAARKRSQGITRGRRKAMLAAQMEKSADKGSVRRDRYHNSRASSARHPKKNPASGQATAPFFRFQLRAGFSRGTYLWTPRSPSTNPRIVCDSPV